MYILEPTDALARVLDPLCQSPRRQCLCQYTRSHIPLSNAVNADAKRPQMFEI